jgi:hypothetical protein
MRFDDSTIDSGSADLSAGTGQSDVSRDGQTSLMSRPEFNSRLLNFNVGDAARFSINDETYKSASDAFDGRLAVSMYFPSLDPPGPTVRAADWRDVPLNSQGLSADEKQKALGKWAEGQVSNVLCKLLSTEAGAAGFAANWLCSKIVGAALENFIATANPAEFDRPPQMDNDSACHLISTMKVESKGTLPSTGNINSDAKQDKLP